MFRKTLVAASAFAFASACLAQSVKFYRADQIPTPIEVAKILGGAGFTPKPKLRGVRMLEGASAPVIAAHPGTLRDEAQSPTALALPVPFAFNSARILPAASEQLDMVAEGIKLTGADKPIIIEGHTDARGNPRYNLALSQKRAAAVKRYFVGQHGIDPALLKIVGKGESEPLNEANPNAAENRRVQFRAG